MNPPSLFPKFTQITDAMREKALKQTAATLRSLDEVRRSLEMPIDQLPVVVALHDKILDAAIVEGAHHEALSQIERTPLTIRSIRDDGTVLRVPPGSMARIRARPQRRAFRPECFVIHDSEVDRRHWLVHDILVGGRSQFEQNRGPIPGTEFCADGLGSKLILTTVHAGLDLEMIVEYVGLDPEGEVFSATVLGTATID